MSEVRLRRGRPAPVREEVEPCELIIRFTPYGWGVPDWYGLSEEVQELLDDHFGTRFVDRKGVTVHVGIVVAKTGRKP
jgi:hypothetical protein